MKIRFPHMRCALVGFLLCTIPTYSQTTLEDVAGGAVFLFTAHPTLMKGKPVFKDGKQLFETRFGTGFLVVTDDDSLFLVTAEHVAKDMKSDFHAVIRGANDTPVELTAEELVGTAHFDWITHGREDVAVARLHPSQTTVQQKLQEHFMPISDVSSDNKSPARERTLTTLGFPLRLGVAEHFSPISRESKPASGLITLARFDTKKTATFFLLADPSVSGFSGAPVLLTNAPYASPNGGLTLSARRDVMCVGIVHGTINDETGGKMAAITPSIYILETINKALRK